MAETIEIPNPPAILPSTLQKKWREDYAAAFRQAELDQSMDLAGRKQYALREANRLLRVPEPTNYSEARALADWQVIERFERQGELRGVMIDSKKFRFPVPAPAPPARPGGPGA